MSLFRRRPKNDPPALQASYTHPDRGSHHFFRHSLHAMRKRFVELVHVEGQPVVFLHGNPHLANYARTGRGAAMVDFDRSVYGPYSWDLVRFLVSVALRAETDGVPRTAIDAVRRGYLFGVNCPDFGWEGMSHLLAHQPRNWQTSTTALIESGNRWAKRLVRHETSPDTRKMRGLLDSYLATQPDAKKVRRRYDVVRGANVPGSMGKLHHLFLLAPNGSKKPRDAVLLDIKETYREASEGPFVNPFEHQGERMVKAGELYAPGWELRPGHATWKGQQYWVRQIPPMSDKLKRRLSEPEQIEIGYAVGTQLGRGHTLSANVDAADLSEHMLANWQAWVAIADVLREELLAAHRKYVKKAA